MEHMHHDHSHHMMGMGDGGMDHGGGGGMDMGGKCSMHMLWYVTVLSSTKGEGKKKENRLH